jgi:hypothetical protein
MSNPQTIAALPSSLMVSPDPDGPPNVAPTISPILDIRIFPGNPIPDIPVMVTDVETPAAILTLSGKSSGQTFVQDGNIKFVNNGSNRIIRITSVADKEGSSLFSVE